MKKWILGLFLLSLPCLGQIGNTVMRHTVGSPLGQSCNRNYSLQDDSTGTIYDCNSLTFLYQLRGGGASAVGTANQIQSTDGSGNLVASAVTADSSGNLNAAAGTQYFHNPANGDGTPNAAAGTSNGLLAKLVNTGGVVQIQTLGTSDTTSYPLLVTAQRVGTTFNGCTSACTTGFAYVAAVGTVAACTFDNTAVVGDFVIDGTTGQCHDTGSATAPTSGTFVGRARTAGTGSQSVSIESQVAGGAGGSFALLCAPQFSSSDSITNADALEHQFLTFCTVPSGTIIANRLLRISACWNLTTPAATIGVITLRLRLGDASNDALGTVLYSNFSPTAPNASQNYEVCGRWDVQGTAAAGASVNTFTGGPASSGATSSASFNPIAPNAVSQPVLAKTNAQQFLKFTIQYSTNTSQSTTTMLLHQLTVEQLN